MGQRCLSVMCCIRFCLAVALDYFTVHVGSPGFSTLCDVLLSQSGARKAGSNASDYRRVQVILEDLIEIRRDLGEQDLEDKRAEETKGFDQFQKAKHRLNIFVQDLRKVSHFDCEHSFSLPFSRTS